MQKRWKSAVNQNEKYDGRYDDVQRFDLKKYKRSRDEQKTWNVKTEYVY